MKNSKFRLTTLVLFVCTALFFTRLHAQLSDTTRIYFDFNSFQPDKKNTEKLRDLISSISEDTLVRSITVDGFTDTVGTIGYNQKLSARRIEFIRTKLNAAGLKANTFFNAHGELISSSPEFFPGITDAESRMVRVVVQRLQLSQTDPKVINNTLAEPESTEPKEKLAFAKIRSDELKIGDTIRLKNINFYPGTDIPLKWSEIVLEELATILDEKKGIKLSIEGHICCRTGGDDNNLSVRRAKFVYEFLIKKGIKRNRLKYSGFGADRKLFPAEANETQQMQNRRVELVIADL